MVMFANDSTILKEMKHYRLKDYVSTSVFIVTTIIAVLVGLLSYFCGATEYSSTLSAFLPISIQACIVLAALTTAGFIMIVSANKDDLFVRFLKKSDLYDGILFLFYEPVIWGIANIIFSTILFISLNLFPSLCPDLGAWMLGIAVWLFFYSVMGYLCLYRAFWMYGEERLTFLNQKENDEKTEDESLVSE